MQNLKLLQQIENYRQSGRFVDAEQLAMASLSRQESPAIRLELTRVLRSQNRFVEANAALAPLLDKQPKNAEVLIEAARVLDGLGDKTAALAAAEKAVAIDVSNPFAWQEVGLSSVALSQFQRAVEAFTRMTALLPKSANAWSSLGNALAEVSALDQAEAALRKAALIAPSNADILLNLGNVLGRIGKPQEAQECYMQAERLSPSNTKALLAQAVLAEKQRRFGDMLQHMLRILQLKKVADVSDYFMGASAAQSVGNNSLALEIIAQGRVHHPNSVRLKLFEMLYLPNFYADHAEQAYFRNRYKQGLMRIGELEATNPLELVAEALQHSNFYLTYQGEDDRELQSVYGDWLHTIIHKAYPDLATKLPTRPNRARPSLAILSSNFSYGTIGKYFGLWPKALEARGFDVTVYHLRPELDEIGKDIGASVSHFEHLPLSSAVFKKTADHIRSQNHDMVLFTDIGMNACAYWLAAVQLAPHQITAWGHPVTTGLSTIDLFISCDTMEPPEAQKHYRERLALLPGIGTYYEASVKAEGKGFWPFSNDDIVFVCPQSIFKIHPDCDVIFGRVLNAVSEAKLVFFTGPEESIKQKLIERLKKSIPATALQRILLLPHLNHQDYLRFTANCTLMLDTLHFSGGNTSLDAFAMGLPVVTLPGAFMRGRQTAGMLNLLGLPELIAKDEDDYVRIARQVAYDPDFLNEIKVTLSRNQNKLFNDTEPLDRLAEILHAELSHSCDWVFFSEKRGSM